MNILTISNIYSYSTVGFAPATFPVFTLLTGLIKERLSDIWYYTRL